MIQREFGSQYQTRQIILVVSQQKTVTGREGLSGFISFLCSVRSRIQTKTSKETSCDIEQFLSPPPKLLAFRLAS